MKIKLNREIERKLKMLIKKELGKFRGKKGVKELLFGMVK